MPFTDRAACGVFCARAKPPATRDAMIRAMKTAPKTRTRPESPAGQRAAHGLNKLQKRLRHGVGRAIGEFTMIEAGDRVMVCLSGGADSYTMLDVLLGLRR